MTRREPETSRPPERKAAAGHCWLVCVAVFAACVQGGYYFLRPDTPRSPDEQEYAALAVSLAEEGRLVLPQGPTSEGRAQTGDVAKRMPLYPALLSLIYRTQLPTLWINAALMMQTFLAWCNTLLVALIAAHLADARAGALAGILAALYAPLLFLQMSVLTETVVIFLLLSAILLYLSAGLHVRSAACLAGLAGVSGLLGLAALTRANALVLIVPFAVDAALRKSGAARRAARVAIVIVPALACAVGWGIRNQRAVGAFTLSTTGGLNFYLGHSAAFADNAGLDHADYNIAARLRAADPDLTEAGVDRLLFNRGLVFARENPGTTATNCLRKLGVWLRPLIPSSGPMTPMLALAFIAVVGWRRFRQGQLRHKRLAVYRIALYGAPLLAIYWLFQITAFVLLDIPGVPAPLPLATPLYVLSLGIPALLFLRSEPRSRGLFAGLIASQLLVAMVFIPLVRIRWTIDALLIIAIAVGISNLARWLRGGVSPIGCHNDADRA
jgi:hypothetical protein